MSSSEPDLRGGRGEDFFETFIERVVNVFSCDINAEVFATCHSVVSNAARNDALEMLELRIDVDGDSVKGHPVPDSDSNGRDFVFPCSFALNPYTNSVGSALASDVEVFEGVDNPLFKVVDEKPNVSFSFIEVEDGVCNSLPGPVVCVLAAPSGLVDGKAHGCKQIAFDGRCSRSVERRMFEEPDEFGGIVMNDVVDAFFHEFDGIKIFDGLRGCFPFGRGHGRDCIIIRPSAPKSLKWSKKLW